MEWISVEDRLPKTFRTVLIWTNASWVVTTARYKYWSSKPVEFNKWVTNEYENIPGDVTHWMPLPEPPVLA